MYLIPSSRKKNRYNLILREITEFSINKFILDKLSKMGKHGPYLEFMHALRQVVPKARV